MYLVKSLVVARKPIRANVDIDWHVGQIMEVDDDQINHYKNNASAFTILSGPVGLEGGLPGTSTNGNAAAGQVGEYLETTVLIGAAVSETTATPVDVAILALTAGDWEVSGTVNRSLAGVTATQYAASISPTANTVPAQAGGSGVGADSSIIEDATMGTTITGNYVSRVGPVRVLLAAGATIHLVAADTFSAGTIGLFGTLRARRVR